MKPLLTVRETAHALGVGETTVYAHLRDGVLTRIKVRRCTRIDPAEVEALRTRSRTLETSDA